jgi:hypothetical protein
LLQETRDFARSIEHLLPGDYDLGIYELLLKEV